MKNLLYDIISSRFLAIVGICCLLWWSASPDSRLKSSASILLALASLTVIQQDATTMTTIVFHVLSLTAEYLKANSPGNEKKLKPRPKLYTLLSKFTSSSWNHVMVALFEDGTLCFLQH